MSTPADDCYEEEELSFSDTDWVKYAQDWFEVIDDVVIRAMAQLSLPVLRIGLAVIFVWFGFLKFFDGLSPAQGLVEATVLELGGLVGISTMPVGFITFVLASWEVAIGVGLLLNRHRRLFLAMMFMQLPGTILPVFVLPGVVWTVFPVGLTLEGQYIVKNLLLIGAGLALGSRIRIEDEQRRKKKAVLDRVRTDLDRIDRQTPAFAVSARSSYHDTVDGVDYDEAEWTDGEWNDGSYADGVGPDKYHR